MLCAGVKLDLSAVHPLTGKVLPLVAADYVAVLYGTQAVMGVAAHDPRDKELAANLHFPVWSVVDEDGRLVRSEQVSTGNTPEDIFYFIRRI